MRRMLFKLVLFLGVIEGLSRIDLMVLLAGMGVAVAVLVCTDLLVLRDP